MDVLFNSINVRDLLSSHDLDDSSPLSAPDLRLLIDRLQVRSLDIKSKVHNYILSHNDEFSNLFSRCSDAVVNSEQLSDQVSNLVNLLSSDRKPIDVQVKETVDEIRSKCGELKEKKDALGLVEVVVKLSRELSVVEDDLVAGKVFEAAEVLTELKVALRVTEDCTEESEPVVFGLLRKKWTECFEEIQQVLVKFVEKAVKFDPQTNSVYVKNNMSMNDDIQGIELCTVLKAMHVVGILDYGLAKVADLMTRHVITPAVGSISHSFSVEEQRLDSGDITEAVLRITPLTGTQVENMDAENIYSGISVVIQFIFNYICFQNSSWMQLFGRLTWPHMSELIISNFLSKIVPDDASKLSDFQTIRQLTSEFETSLKEVMFISSEKDERLTNFTDNVEVHFATRKKVEILATARDLLLHSNFKLPKEYTRKSEDIKNGGNVDLLFSSERCSVSETALQLLELVHQTLKDVCLSSPTVALEFCHAARDALLLYEAVIPVKLERQLDGINQVAVLIHNDCLFLSQEILGLKFEYQSDFPTSVKGAVFIDLGIRYKLMAEEILQRQIQLVKHNLMEAIDGADGFQNTHQPKRYESAKFSIDQVAFILEKVRIIWEPLLLPLTYKRSMCTVVEAVCSRMTKDILQLDDIAAEETLQIQRLIHMLLENLSSLLESLVGINQTTKPQEALSSSIDDLIPSLPQLRVLADMLDMPLKSITASWESGELAKCGYTSSEVKDFIRAIFTDSPLRKECLWRIENIKF
ncbi:putative RZZ complex, subunit Zw10 protein [Helianthus annuus]|uniref:Putative centromere/kinetochore protein, putative (ZW10) n=1 Tax=Helianthus annuus TaxID=4232 RepID=A0A251RY26_HELAN|nr:centromere/kinetochore protein zw10 homolog [Helianthus annuus]KAF5758857.1 putative RZZ complex, subunit Zw10 protein [Helianthus annuus]KAJ0437143.1 putative RZZ complex, subunit Zw10 protein [Helianthus annuus]KAJ0459452.1 putative RZZ complex, subunit Zw10 protein [Helianthus annuus]KAJ0643935.1 putative RZZ complex, subunit Zw10 protein [Helianthus annuus]KAJ0820146.1 putative RZZ complex, subunit Zw10 protein [Helianthus annuus]